MATAIPLDTSAPRGTTVTPALILDHLMIIWQLVKIPREATLHRKIGCVINTKKKGVG